MSAGIAVLVVACGPSPGAIDALAVGDCFDDPGGTAGIEEVPVVACEEPHRYEVAGAVLMPDAVRPGPDLEEAAVDACAPSFTDYLGVSPDDSVLHRAVLVPTAEGWEDGDREALCLVTDPAGSLVGSVAGAGR